MSTDVFPEILQDTGPAFGDTGDQALLLRRIAEAFERLLVQLAQLEEVVRHSPPRLVPVAVDLATAAKLLGIGRTLFYDLRKGDGPPVVDLGGCRVIRTRSLDLWMAGREGKR